MPASDVKKSPGRPKEEDKEYVRDALEEVPQEVAEDEVVTDYAKRLQGKTVQELRILHDEALVDESEAKRHLVLLRQRAAMMASTTGPDVDEEIMKAKDEAAKSAAWLFAIEKKLEGEFKDISGVHKF